MWQLVGRDVAVFQHLINLSARHGMVIEIRLAFRYPDAMTAKGCGR